LKRPTYHRFYFFVAFCFVIFSACRKSVQKPAEQAAIITIDPSSMSITKNTAYSYPLTVKENNVVVPSSAIKWSSSDTTVATINSNGYVKGVGGGQAVITATLNDRKGNVTSKITVNDNYTYKYRLILKDKGASTYSVSRPEEFLSDRAISRRRRQNISVNESDLPISAAYLQQISNAGGKIVTQSKWLNTVTVYCKDSHLLTTYKQLPFVKDAVVVWQGANLTPSTSPGNSSLTRTGTNQSSATADSTFYGPAWRNISINNGQYLHRQGYEGDGIDIALIDAGFINLTTNAAFSNTNIKGAKSFIYEDANPYNTDEHGVWTSSCMAINKPGVYVGTAPAANYWFFRTEDQTSEYPVEEDYMVAAMEYADSVGVDVINTSLSYTSHDGNTFNYVFSDMDGKTAFASRGANMAADKGMLIVCCAGNEQSWIGAPGDSPEVLTVGAVNIKKGIDTFTSFGVTVDGRMKPDIVSLGGGASVITSCGTTMQRNGTSYASPIVCGLAACLWQAFPKLTNKDIIDIVRKSADRYNNPVVPYGYGIPDMQKAMQLAKVISDAK
jgi:hypothetical protein